MIDWSTLVSYEDQHLVSTVVGRHPRGVTPRNPDETITPGGKPYIYRWHVIPRRIVGANLYLHLQVADDPERPLHDHPWDNQSVILAGGYREYYDRQPGLDPYTNMRLVQPGDVIQRKATEAHRLTLLGDYSISLFSTGPVIREWGFWTGAGWVPYTELKERIG